MKVVCVFTCFNRKDVTKKAIEKLKKNKCKVDFVIVDDNSKDGTFEMIESMNDNHIKLLRGDGNLYYAGGMRMGLQYLLGSNEQYDYLLLTNDDADFFEGIIDKMINYSQKKDNAVVVGSMVDSNNKTSYSGKKYKSKFSTKLYNIGPDQSDLECDTFSGNCVLIPYSAFIECGNYDPVYIHNFAEFDYGFNLRKHGYHIYVLNEYVARANSNSSNNTWYDTSLSMKERIKKKEGPKGAPGKIVFYYFKKNFNIFMAIRCYISPYIRILLRK